METELKNGKGVETGGCLVITIKGARGAGKTHLARWLVGQLVGQGHDVVFNDAGLGCGVPPEDQLGSPAPDIPKLIAVDVPLVEFASAWQPPLN